MLQVIGLMVAVYGIVRFLQIPVEHTPGPGNTALLWVLSVLGILGLGGLALVLLTQGTAPSSVLQGM